MYADLIQLIAALAVELMAEVIMVGFVATRLQSTSGGSRRMHLSLIAPSSDASSSALHGVPAASHRPLGLGVLVADVRLRELPVLALRSQGRPAVLLERRTRPLLTHHPP